MAGNFFTLICFFFSIVCFGREIKITAESGKSYILPDRLVDTRIIIVGIVDKNSPFILSGNGKTQLLGNSSIQCTTSNIIIKDLNFVNNLITYKESDALISIGSAKKNISNIVITNCHMSYIGKFPDKDVSSQFFWIKLSGRDVSVDKCLFEGKQNRLPIIHVDSGKRAIVISNCIFKNVSSRKGEALEAIRIGLADGDSDCKIIKNEFLNYHGDSETISCKASGILIENNKFINSRSGISLRWADSCMIKANKFINTVNPIRISGQGHLIINNYFEGNQKRTLSFMKGAKLLANEVRSYKRAENITIQYNVFNIKPELRVIESVGTTMVPDNIIFKDNYIRKKNKLIKIEDFILNSSFFLNKKIVPEIRKDKSKIYTYPLSKN